MAVPALIATALILAGVGLSLGGANDAGRYGDRLLAEAAHRSGAALHIEARDKGGAPIAIGPAVTGGVTVPLADAMGHAIGTLTAAPGTHAAATAAWLSRRIYVAGNLAEPDPFIAGAVHAPRADALVEKMLARFPDLVTLALHVAPPGGGNIIAASSFGRIGKPGDSDDRHVEQDGAVLREVTDSGTRLAVELPLLDRTGHSIGALSTSFTVPAGSDPQMRYVRAVAVRDALARRIPSRAALFAR
ncbi:MAG: hypothetical protein JWL96_973 [Sphingomonas bacterium]|uniref:hypothetical protein n=1 Tax=Sphingomonas bacterium TaxID=1895847 RepID=UPI002605B0AE|nr:hypothetical protein [Sphingomonas bacterium]MDB5708903.1 hypothetical protein [Sphingomonas bacterium]